VTDPLKPRPRPCASCPYRVDVPSGIWHPDEYAKLVGYDADTWAQPLNVFMCHQGDDQVCSGWLGHRDPSDLLAVRLGLASGHLDAACVDYSTTVPLWPSGAAAARHGCRDVPAPSPEAVQAIEKITTVRASRGNPVT